LGTTAKNTRNKRGDWNPKTLKSWLLDYKKVSRDDKVLYQKGELGREEFSKLLKI